jgi:hypothetical protein
MTCALVPEPLERVARDCGAPLRSSQLDVETRGDGCVAKAKLEVDDHRGIVVVRAHVAGATAEAAVDHACRRVHEQLDAMVKDPLAIGSSTVRPRWTFGRGPAHRPRFAHKRAADRSVVRTKTYSAMFSEPEHARLLCVRGRP